MRYYKATDGHVTVFRGSAERVYHSAAFRSACTDGEHWTCGYGISFSAKPTQGPGRYPCEEIVQSEYEALSARKILRLKAAGRDLRGSLSPQDSWVANAAFQPPSWEAKLHGQILGYFPTAEAAQACVDAALAEVEDC
jgi:hypothetical protein